MAHLLVDLPTQHQTNSICAGQVKRNDSDMILQLLKQLSILFIGDKQCIGLNRMGLVEYCIRIANSVWVYATIVGDHAVISLIGTQDPVYLQLCRAVMDPHYVEFIQLDHNSPVLYFDKLREEAPDLVVRIEALIRVPVYPDVNKLPEGSPVLTRTK